ncbi:diaminopimelate decarboxylase [soil metagenome]|jgi:diaminopimelate decarboxylase|nr:diaminopimelate decarboxylase [Chloroflexota bacterium]
MTALTHEAMRQAARRYGTPLYLYDLVRLDADAQAIRDAFPDPWLRLYALKANGLPGLLERLPGIGFGASAVSGGELQLARRAGFPTALTALEGVGKSTHDLERAVAQARAGRPLLWVSVESAEEAAVLARLMAGATNRAGRPTGRRSDRHESRLDVLVRLNPQVRPETHLGLAVGAADSKFGVLTEELAEVIDAGGGVSGPLRWRGLHVHVGSQLGAVDAWRSAMRVGFRVLGLQRASLPDFDTLDCGSGFPVDHGLVGSVPSIRLFAAAVHQEMNELPEDARPKRLAIEPGRAVVAGAGWLVASVLHVRSRERPIVVLDAGMTELIRPALYGAEHPLLALTSMRRAIEPASGDGEPAAMVRVDGPVCESTDRLGEAALPPLRRDDLVAIGVAGAYASSMASTYNGRPRPPEIAWDGVRLSLLRRRGRI